MNTKEKIEIMQAYLDGKPIQYKLSDHFDWTDYTNGEPSWTFGKVEYRVKPKDPAYVAYQAYCNASEHVFLVPESQFKFHPSYSSWQAVVRALKAIPE